MKINHLPLPCGLVVSARTGGGGGYGPPWKRQVEAVVSDVADGYVSQTGAQNDYGLRFEKDGEDADPEATAAARANMAERGKAVPW
jgi:N-methylhydantoinase B